MSLKDDLAEDARRRAAYLEAQGEVTVSAAEAAILVALVMATDRLISLDPDNFDADLEGAVAAAAAAVIAAEPIAMSLALERPCPGCGERPSGPATTRPRSPRSGLRWPRGRTAILGVGFCCANCAERLEAGQ